MLERFPTCPPRGLRAAALTALLALGPAAGADALVRYIAFGDSITEGLNFDDCVCECALECGYPLRLEGLLREEVVPDAVVENHGLGGEKTPEGLTRIDGVLAGGGDVLLLMEGTNDISRAISPETTLFNLAEMARKAADAGIVTVHATLIPRYPAANVDAQNILNADLARNIRDIAFENRRNLVDTFAVFSATPGLFEVYYDNEHPTDGVGHPNPAGYDLLAEVFFKAIAGIDEVPPVLGPVSPISGSEENSPFSRVDVRFYDFGSGINLGATRLLVNGSAVPFSASGNPLGYDLTYVPVFPLPEDVFVTLQARDLATPFNGMSTIATQFGVNVTPPEPCVADEITLCIDDEPGDQRFRVTMSWETALGGGLGGDAVATPLAEVGLDAGGLLSFVPGNPEVLIKVLDGCEENGFFWVFGASTTTLGFELEVVDTLAHIQGAPPSQWFYSVTNVDGEPAAPFFDTQAFDTCDFSTP